MFMWVLGDRISSSEIGEHKGVVPGAGTIFSYVTGSLPSLTIFSSSKMKTYPSCPCSPLMLSPPLQITNARFSRVHLDSDER